MKTKPTPAFVKGMIVLTALVVVAVLSGCAGTDLYDRNGKRLARMEGDMTNVKYHMDKNGAVTFSADKVNHSAATIAAGKTSAGNLAAAGAAFATVGIVP